MPDADLTDRLDRIPSFARASLDRLRQMKAAARAGDFAVAPRERLKATQRLLADFVYIYDRCLAEPTSDEVERRLAELANGVIRPLASRPIDADETPSRRGRAYQAAAHDLQAGV